MAKISSIIIDDEANGRENLRGALDKYCPEISVVAEADSCASGIEMINRLQPDVIFLDIEMPGGSGIELLELYESPSFGVIFVTAYDQYAIQAIRLSAIDYLLKPINIIELKNAIARFISRKKEQSILMTQQFKQNWNIDPLSKKIALPTTDKIEFREIRDIIRCEGEGNYTHFFFTDQSKLLISRSLVDFEELLETFGFLRTHKTHLINPIHIKSFHKANGCSLTMSNGQSVPVSRRRKEFILQKLKG